MAEHSKKMQNILLLCETGLLVLALGLQLISPKTQPPADVS